VEQEYQTLLCNTFYRHHSFLNLYSVFDDEMMEYHFYKVINNPAVFHNVLYQTDMAPREPGLYAVEVTLSKRSLVMIGRTSINSHASTIQPESTPQSLTAAFRKLPDSIQQICGKVVFPPDDGKLLIDYLEQHSESLCLYGASDASFKINASHAWVISSGNVTDINDPFKSIHGSGPVDGYGPHLSSTHGELQGQTAIAIVTNLFLRHHNSSIPIRMICDNKSAIAPPVPPTLTRIRFHRDPDVDLRLQLQHQLHTLSTQHEWVKAHQDTKPWQTIQGLWDLQLSCDVTYNSWCDRMAMESRLTSFSDPSPLVLPAEKWAVYVTHPNPHKITKDFNESIYSCLSYPTMTEYLKKKHNLSVQDLDFIGCADLRGFLKTLPVSIRATYIELIHNWIPTQSFLHKQCREHSPICPLCSMHDETACHMLTCPDPRTDASRRTALSSYFRTLLSIHTPISIIHILEDKLSFFLQIPTDTPYVSSLPPLEYPETLQAAKIHQNLLGWDFFLRGFLYNKWTTAYDSFYIADSTQTLQQWFRKFVASTLTFTHSIWRARNHAVHGNTRLDHHRKERERIILQVKQLYANPPILHRRYTAVLSIPLETRIQNSTSTLKR
jgi:hypothetical protein